MKNCCERPGCRVLAARTDNRGTPLPFKSTEVEAKAHVGICSENLRQNAVGAMLERPLFATTKITITRNAQPGDIRLLLDYDDRHRAQEKLNQK